MKLVFESRYDDNDIEFFDDQLNSEVSDLYGMVDHHLIPRVLRKLASGRYSNNQIIELAKGDPPKERDIKDIVNSVSMTIHKYGDTLPKSKIRQCIRSCADTCDWRNEDIDEDNKDE